ncbi:MAG: TonB-dependent receptor plug domain-containing protein [Muribaculaceae bacterium]|nr:TonB-dependent receptor plug domain-containing protein [Muribaculaceae bacterium]
MDLKNNFYIVFLLLLVVALEAIGKETPDSTATTLDEVVVTAREGEGMTSASRIGKDAMKQLQPTSFTDLLELLPGNISQNPEMGKANTITLRETGNLGATGAKSDNDDYSMSSLGTLFMVDGAPINGDANLQTVGIGNSDSPASVRNVTNKGVDMRAISTDNIESVEIVRGIPSAEYGNLTTGLVKIKRINRSTPVTARFKADEYSKLFAVSKGIAMHEDDDVINLDLSYLDSKTDPRNNLENYKRLTGSARFCLNRQNDKASYTWNIGGDYTGSFDNAKNDPDLNLMKVDEYKSEYNRVSLTSDLQIDLWNRGFISDINFNASASYQNDVLTRRKQVAPQRASVAPITMKPGEHIGEYLLGEYIADFRSEGKPINIFLKGKAGGEKEWGITTHNYKGGVEWTLSKNLGRGEVYDLQRPISASWTSRPRDFREIPALQVLSLFLEDKVSLNLGGGLFTLQAGLRGIMLPSLPKEYYLHARPYFDPRVNASWVVPIAGKGADALMLTLNVGYGLTTKMPTIDYLYPQAQYTDIIQLNYYDTAKPSEHSLVSLMTYINDATNYQLHPARNRKQEITAGLAWKGNSFSVTYFRENLSSGFRYSSVYAPYSYKDYDISAIDQATLTGPPDLSMLPYEEKTILKGYRIATNGTRIAKQGVEFTATTARWKALRTRLSITGAWFRSEYSNSERQYATVNDVVNGISVSDRYVGIYNYRDGRVNEQLNTNFMFDTQIPKWGLVFTSTFQIMWWVKTTRMPIDGTPDAYISADDGEIHPYIPDQTGDDLLLPFLIKTYNEDTFKTIKIPFAGYFNLKATKSIGKHLRIALFVNRILDWLPDYHANGLLVRRSSDAYFGMELNLSI